MKYSPLVTDHFEHPRNTGPLPDATCMGEAENAACLDRLRLYLRVDAATNRITAATFEAQGCVPALAVGSLLTEYVTGRAPDDLRRLTPDLLENEMGGLPATKKHAAHLGVEALHDALDRIG